MARAKDQTLGDRVTQLIDQFWGGTVYAAAKGWGVPLQTLYRIANGGTANPRATILTRIASACGTTVEWLLTGAGEGPVTQDASGVHVNAGYLRWERAIDRLKLEPMVVDAVTQLGFSLWRMSFWLDRELGGHESPDPHRVNADEWHIEQLNLWAARLESYIEHFGVQRVADAMRKRAYFAMVGFGPNATLILQDKERGPKLEKELAQNFRIREALPLFEKKFRAHRRDQSNSGPKRTSGKSR